MEMSQQNAIQVCPVRRAEAKGCIGGPICSCVELGKQDRNQNLFCVNKLLPNSRVEPTNPLMSTNPVSAGLWGCAPEVRCASRSGCAP
eukprot:2865104-Amphidinium_carterae.1